MDDAARPPHGWARFSGSVYAIVVVAGTFSLGYAPGRVFAGASPEEIAQSVAANEGLFRALIAAELLCYVAFLVLALALYRLLAHGGQFAAALMAVLVFASVPIACLNVAHHFTVLRAIATGAVPDVITTAQAHYGDGLRILKIFWGGWLIPFGLLVIRSGFLPRLLGGLLILGGLGYVADFACQLLWPDYAASGLATIFRAPRVAEIIICVWVLAFGARRLFVP
ncbi:MAG: DUF4386 domain-containing protein [Caulobacteraceae bacterium]